MSIRKDSQHGQSQERFSIRLLKFCARILGVLLVAAAFAFAASRSTGVLQWVLGGIAVLCLVGLGLFINAYSAEVQRSLGPLPLGHPDEDLANPFSEDRTAERAAKRQIR